MDQQGSAVMRLLGAVVVAVIMYVAVPMLWERAMVYKVNEMSNQPSPFATTNMVPAFDSNMVVDVNTMYPRVEIDTKKYEQIAVQAQVDQAVRQSQQAQDQAWQATHRNVP
jgi:hypothetical protein